MKITKKRSSKSKPKRKLREGHNRTPKSDTQPTMSFNLRQFPTELVWKIRKKSAELQMTVKAYVIQEMTKATTDVSEPPKHNASADDPGLPLKQRKKIAERAEHE
jgi:hypothetical protein